MAAVCDNAMDALDRFQANANAQILALKEEWSTSAATEPSPDLQRAPQGASIAPGHHPVSPGVAEPAGQPTQPTPDPWATELAEAERIRSLSWEQYADERQARGIGSPAGLFSV